MDFLFGTLGRGDVGSLLNVQDEVSSFGSYPCIYCSLLPYYFIDRRGRIHVITIDGIPLLPHYPQHGALRSSTNLQT